MYRWKPAELLPTVVARSGFNKLSDCTPEIAFTTPSVFAGSFKTSERCGRSLRSRLTMDTMHAHTVPLADSAWNLMNVLVSNQVAEHCIRVPTKLLVE